jgi:hypothetical protein
MTGLISNGMVPEIYIAKVCMQLIRYKLDTDTALQVSRLADSITTLNNNDVSVEFAERLIRSPFCLLWEDKESHSPMAEISIARLLLSIDEKTSDIVDKQVRLMKEVSPALVVYIEQDRERIRHDITNERHRTKTVMRYMEYFLPHDRELWLSCFRSGVETFVFRRIRFQSDELRQDPDIALAAVLVEASNYGLLAHFHPHNVDILKAAVVGNGRMVQHAPDYMKQNRTIAWIAVNNSGSSLEFLPAFQNDFKMVLAAVKNDGYALQPASKTLKQNLELVLAVIARTPYALLYADKRFRTDEKHVLSIIEVHPSAVSFTSSDMRDNERVMGVAVKGDYKTIHHASDRLKGDYAFMLAAITHDARVFGYASLALQKNPDIIKAANDHNDR